MLDNGLLLSCSYDKRVKAWQYQQQALFYEFEKTEELRCMDYVTDSGTLLIGTNTHAILPHNITDLMNFENLGRIGGMDESEAEYGSEEEKKEQFEDEGDEYYLEGMTLDEKIAQLTKNANQILEKDKKGYLGEKEDQQYKFSI